MSAWLLFLIALAALHLGGLIAFALKGNVGMATVMLGGFLVQVGLMMQARG